MGNGGKKKGGGASGDRSLFNGAAERTRGVRSGTGHATWRGEGEGPSAALGRWQLVDSGPRPTGAGWRHALAQDRGGWWLTGGPRYSAGGGVNMFEMIQNLNGSNKFKSFYI
jgi:hypothetical protein